MSTKDLFESYEHLKAVIKDAEEKIKALQSEIVELIPEGKDVSGNYGVFKVQSRATWKFSAVHTKRKEELKTLEEEEKAKGTAKATYSPVLYYTVSKETNYD